MTANPRGSEETVAQFSEHVSPSTRLPFPPLVVREGAGAEFRDADGRRFLDLHSMACIANVGHASPRVVQAIRDQSERLLHCNSAYLIHEEPTRLASELKALTPGTFEKKVAFGLSGSDGNDGALKLVRKATGRSKVVAFLRSYHGNTYGAMSLSAVSLAMREGFGPLIPDVHHIPFPDAYRGPGAPAATDVSRRSLDAFDELLETVAPPNEVAAVFVEPIQGDAGILVPPEGFLPELADRCRRNGILLVAEEVQTGMGRTGTWCASEHFGVEPDVVILGKALASGLPLSAVVARAELMDRWGPPGHVFSVGANPVCCAAARATIDVVHEERLLANTEAMGGRFVAGFAELARRFDVIGDVRGRGLMIGVDLVTDPVSRERAHKLTAKVLVGCYARGVYLTFLRGSVLRIAPPLVINAAQVDTALQVFDEAIGDALAGRVSDAAAEQVTGW